MFRIKICGVTTSADALLAAEAGADAVGVNFYRGSPRYVSPTQAAGVLDVLPPGVARVGVFVNAPASEIAEIADRLRLDFIQLHGDEPPEQIAELAPRPVIKAFRCGPEGINGLIAYLEFCERRGVKPAGVLLDAASSGEYGGTGRLTDWQVAVEYRQSLRVPPLVLAGGLTPENVAEAIRTVRPAAVDTASGVESSPRQKEPERLRKFTLAAREAFSEMRVQPE